MEGVERGVVQGGGGTRGCKVVSLNVCSMDHTVMDGHMSRVFGLQFHPSDHRILLTAGWDDTVQFWDIRQRHSTR